MRKKRLLFLLTCISFLNVLVIGAKVDDDVILVDDGDRNNSNNGSGFMSQLGPVAQSCTYQYVIIVEGKGQVVSAPGVSTECLDSGKGCYTSGCKKW